MKNSKLAAAVVGGYFLGRWHKARWALALAGLAAGKRISTNPGVLIGQLLESSPQLRGLVDEMRGDLTEAGKNAVVAAASNRMGSLTDRLQQQTEAVRDRTAARDRDEESDDSEPDEETEEPEDEEPEDEEPEEPEDEEEPEPPRRRSSRTSSTGSKGRASSTGSKGSTGSTGSAAKRPARSTAAKKTAAPRRAAADRKSSGGGSSGSGAKSTKSTGKRAPARKTGTG
ncbi:hypothetical protein ABZ747_35805 [Kitasatospora cineracea]|uniref:hypothetical protein n=1 Tax=Kitasatospora cineracea TaxID=88074 RepID=UPI0033E73DC2